MTENKKRNRTSTDENIINVDDATNQECPMCGKPFPVLDINLHVHFCLQKNQYKRSKQDFSASSSPKPSKSPKLPIASKNLFNIFSPKSTPTPELDSDSAQGRSSVSKPSAKASLQMNVPLAEKMRPNSLDDYYGQTRIIGENTFIKKIFESDGEFPSMLLWGPAGSGKTTLAHIIETKYKTTHPDKYKFIKMSATLSGIADVKKIFEQATNSSKYNIKTILFLDEVHRFNKLQQDIFLSHIERGIITLICATTENPSYCINAALLSRCRVIKLEKLETEDVFEILQRALDELDIECVDSSEDIPNIERKDGSKQFYLENEALRWLAEVSDGDARIALGNLEMAHKMLSQDSKTLLTLADIRDEIKKSHILYDKAGEEHYNTISALHKSIRASDQNATLYWVTRMLVGGDDPKFICRRLIRAASEDIGLMDSNALVIATATLQAVMHIGMPEADCIIAQCAVYLAQAPKSRLIQNAYNACKKEILECKGALPVVPLRLRNISNPKIFSAEEFEEEEGIESCMPSGLESKNYFNE